MDPVILFVIAVVVIGGAFWLYESKSDVSDVVETKPAPAPAPKAEVKTEAKAEAKVEVKKLPTKSKLSAMKKAELEELGREFGIELDKRKTKDSMIVDLQKEAKKK
jgi:hypothetical protein